MGGVTVCIPSPSRSRVGENKKTHNVATKRNVVLEGGRKILNIVNDLLDCAIFSRNVCVYFFMVYSHVARPASGVAA